jgi:hypothetical protein
MNLPFFQFGTVPLKIKGFQFQNTKVELPTVLSLARQHGYSGLPDSILVAKTNHLRSKKVIMAKDYISIGVCYLLEGKL